MDADTHDYRTDAVPMTTNLTRYKEDMDRLATLADRMLVDLTMPELPDTSKLTKEKREIVKNIKGSFDKNYQRWYTEASAVVRQLIPSRITEFESYYRSDPKRKDVGFTTFAIQDWMTGIRAAEDWAGDKSFDDRAIVAMRFKTQLEILRSAAARFESSLVDIQHIVQADLMDSELEAATELVKKGFHRAAGVISGVVLERHLAQVVVAHKISSRKKHPTIGDFNEALKANGTIDIPAWRMIQRLSDLRNLSAHNGDREPTKDEVLELVSGVEKITKTIF